MLFTIVHRGDRWYVESEAGKPLGDYATEGEAKERLRQVEAAKAAKQERHMGALIEQLGMGGGNLFDVARGADGKLPVGRWDRGMTPGVKEKEGKVTEFNVRTFGQMIDNWLARGEKLSLCYNHQSAYAKDNGEPAPAMAFYNAVAIVDGGKLVRFEKLLSSDARPPSVAELANYCEKLATEQNPKPSPDGCWWYRFEHTEIGERLLSGFAFLSPMFVPNGKDEQGAGIGYVIYDLAATNTAFQGGCLINLEQFGRFGAGDYACIHCGQRFTKAQLDGGDKIPAHQDPSKGNLPCGGAGGHPGDAQYYARAGELKVGDRVKHQGTERTIAQVGRPDDASAVLVRGGGYPDMWLDPRDVTKMTSSTGATGAKGARAMKFNVAFAVAHLGLTPVSTDADVKVIYAKKMEEAKACMEGEDDGAKFKKFADSSEEMAKHYEDAYADDDKEEGKEPPHVTMRRFATKFRKLAADTGDKKGDEGDEKEKEKMEEAKMEARLLSEYKAIAARLQIPVPPGTTSKQLMDAIKATAVPASDLPAMMEREIKKALLERDTKAKEVDVEQRAKMLAESLEAPEEDRKAIYELARNPAMFDHAVRVAKRFELKKSVTPQLFERITTAGNPIALEVDPRAPATPGMGSGADRKIVKNELATFVVEGGEFSKMAIEWADAKSGAVKEEIDAMLGEHEREHGGYRLIAANKLLAKKRPELFERAEHAALFSY